jgi:3-dehydroquinate dehydratase II
MRFLIINGPNLNLLGSREPELYGVDTLVGLEAVWRRHATRIGASITTFQSNHEGAIIDTIQAEAPRHDGIVINAGALSHTSYAIHDALVAVSVPTVEVHISNIHTREPWRRTSVTAPAAFRTIVGRGTSGYIDAINLLHTTLTDAPDVVSYGPEEAQTIELRKPEGSSRGLIGLIHGGFWHEIFGRDLMDPLAVALTSHGWTTANIEYRRGPGSFERSTADIAASVAWLRTHDADSTEGTRLWLIGHSAGGYLAIRQALADDGLAGVIALGSVIDLDAIAAARGQDDPVSEYLGGDRSEVPDVWERAALSHDPVSDVWLIHGAADDTTPLDHAGAFAARDRTELVALGDVGHMEVIDPYDAAFTAIVDILGS